MGGRTPEKVTQKPTWYTQTVQQLIARLMIPQLLEGGSQTFGQYKAQGPVQRDYSNLPFTPRDLGALGLLPADTVNKLFVGQKGRRYSPGFMTLPAAWQAYIQGPWTKAGNVTLPGFSNQGFNFGNIPGFKSGHKMLPDIPYDTTPGANAPPPNPSGGKAQT